MSDLEARTSKSWCIVVADDHGPEYVPSIAGSAKESPVQYCGFGEPTTLLQRALHRAKQIAPTAQIMVTVREENRVALGTRSMVHSFGAAFCLRFSFDVLVDDGGGAVVDCGGFSLERGDYFAGALLCGRRMDIVRRLHRLHAMLPRIPEGVGTLGMIDIDDGIDEDYLVPGRHQTGPRCRSAGNGAATGRMGGKTPAAARRNGCIRDLDGLCGSVCSAYLQAPADHDIGTRWGLVRSGGRRKSIVCRYISRGAEK